MKTCFKCYISKPLSDYYSHPKMADGYLNKCKSCTKADSMQHRETKIDDPEWIQQERDRCRLKAARRRRDGKVTRGVGAQKRWAAANKHKRHAQSAADSLYRLLMFARFAPRGRHLKSITMTTHAP